MRPIIRPQTDDDLAAVQDLIAAAFAAVTGPAGSDGAGPPVEVALNAELVRDPAIAPDLTLVADSGGRIVGQLTSSYGELTAAGGSMRPVVGVGPVAVAPDQQGRGIGSALMRALVAAASAKGEPALVLLGSPAYYGRFGFVAAADLGIEAPDPAWGGYFQAHPLGSPPGSLAGRYRYAAPFDRL